MRSPMPVPYDLVVKKALTGRRNPVADLYRQTAFLAFCAILAAFRICKLQKTSRTRGFDSRRLHHTKSLVITDLLN